VHLYATLTKYLPAGAGGRTCRLELEESQTVSQVMAHLGIPEESVKLIFVNGVHGAKSTLLTEGDRLGLFPPVGGG